MTMALQPLPIRPAEAASIYRGVEAGQFGLGGGGAAFGAMLDTAVKGTIATLGQAETASMAGLSGHADVTDVVTAVSKAELTLQTAMTIRDRVVQAYQEIIKMPI